MESSKIKICIIIPNLKCGGSERFISILCNHINTNKFLVELYILDGANKFYEITNPEIKVTSFSIKNVRNSLFLIGSILRKTRPNILLTSANHLNVFLAIFKSLFPREITFVARESSIVSINNRQYSSIYDQIAKAFYKKIDFIICQSKFMQKDLIKNYQVRADKTIIIHNPVEETNYKPNINSTPSRISQFKFISVGRLSKEKGIARILRALCLLTLDFKFHIIGEGPELQHLVELTNTLNLQGKIIFHGLKAMPYEGMLDADLFLIGSFYEGFPNVLLEAGILGIPVVGFHAPGGISEIISDGISGLLVSDDNTGEHFSAAIIKCLDMPRRRQLIIDNTRIRFSLEKIMDEVEFFFEKIHLKF